MKEKNFEYKNKEKDLFINNQQKQLGNMNRNNAISCKRIIIKEKLIFIPIILIKILLSFYLYEKYFCYNLVKQTDIVNSQKVFFCFILYLSFK